MGGGGGRRRRQGGETGIGRSLFLKGTRYPRDRTVQHNYNYNNDYGVWKVTHMADKIMYGPYCY